MRKRGSLQRRERLRGANVQKDRRKDEKRSKFTAKKERTKKIEREGKENEIFHRREIKKVKEVQRQGQGRGESTI